MNGLANKEVCVAMSFSADYAASRARAKAAGVDVNLAFTVPKEGANASYDAFLIPGRRTAPGGRVQVHQFHAAPQVIAEITNELHYGNDNLAANALVDPQILNDPTIYPTPAIEARLYRAAEVSAATERICARAPGLISRPPNDRPRSKLEAAHYLAERAVGTKKGRRRRSRFIRCGCASAVRMPPASTARRGQRLYDPSDLDLEL